MNTSVPPGPVPPARQSFASRKRWLLWGLVSLLALVGVIGASVALTIWWIQRPIKPVVLSAAEKSSVEEKLRAFEADTTPNMPVVSKAPASVELEAPAAARNSSPPMNRPYVAGSKELRLTQRELNGLLNLNTDLGKSVRLELTTDAINAYLAVPIPKDFPIGGGKMFRARGRFRVSLGESGEPFAVLEDVTVFGLSLPNAWLGGVKGQNLLSNLVSKGDGGPVVRGIKSLRVEPGALVLRVEE